MITFKNGTSYNQTAVYGNTSHQGMTRKTLRICLSDTEATLQEAYALYLNRTALSEITITEVSGETTETNILLNYTMPVEFKVSEINGVTNYQLIIAQKSDLEIEQEQQAQSIVDAQLAIAEMLDMALSEE